MLCPQLLLPLYMLLCAPIIPALVAETLMLPYLFLLLRYKLIMLELSTTEYTYTICNAVKSAPLPVPKDIPTRSILFLTFCVGSFLLQETIIYLLTLVALAIVAIVT